MQSAIDINDAAQQSELGNLGKLLFPDPSKAAHSYYYGTEARKALIEAQGLANKQTAQQFVPRAAWHPDEPLPEPTYSPSSIPNVQAGVLNPPSPAAQAMNPGNPGPAPLAQAMQTNPGLPGQLAASNVPTAVNNYNASRATPANNPPTQETPNATPPTGTSGQNVTYNTPLAPNSVLPPGPQVNSGPATHTGSPAPLAVTPQQIAAVGSMAGYDANLVNANVQSMWSTLFARGQISRPTYEAGLAGSGVTTPYTTAQEVAGRQQVATQHEAAETGRTRLTVGGENYRAGLPLQQIPVPGRPDLVQNLPLAQAQGPGGIIGGSTVSATEGAKNIEVQPTPGGPSFSVPAWQAQQGQPAPITAPSAGGGLSVGGAITQPPVTLPTGQPLNQTLYPPPRTGIGMPLYQKGTADILQTQQGAVDNYIDRKNPTVLIPATFAEAQANGYVSVPKTKEGWDALISNAVINQPPEQAQRTRDAIMQLQIATSAKPLSAEESLQRGYVVDQRLQARMPPPSSPGAGLTTPLAESEYPAGASAELDPVLINLSEQYHLFGPNEARRDPSVATDMAINQLAKQGHIKLDQNRGQAAPYIGGGTTTVTRPTISGGTTTNFRVDLLDPSTGKPYAPGKAPAVIPMEKTFGAQISGPAPFERVQPTKPAGGGGGVVKPPGAIEAAPGQSNGTRGTHNGKPAVVRDGWVYYE